MGYSVDEVEGGPLSRLLPFSFRQKHDEILEDVRKTGRLRRPENSVIGWGRKSDGSVVRLQVFVKFSLQGEILRVEALFYQTAEGKGEAIALADVYGFVQAVTPPLAKLAGLSPSFFEEKKLHLCLLNPEFVRSDEEGLSGVEEYLKIQAEEDPLIKINFPSTDDPRLEQSDNIFRRFYAEMHVQPIIDEVIDDYDEDSQTPFLVQKVEQPHSPLVTGGGLVELRNLSIGSETRGSGLSVKIRSGVETARNDVIFVKHKFIGVVGLGNRLRKAGSAGSTESFKSFSASFEGSGEVFQIKPVSSRFLDAFPEYLNSLRESSNPFHKPGEAVPSKMFGAGHRFAALVAVAVIFAGIAALIMAILLKMNFLHNGILHCDQLLSIFFFFF